MTSLYTLSPRCSVVVSALGQGGSERQALLMVRALRELGMDARLIALGPPYTLLQTAPFQDTPVEHPVDRLGIVGQVRFLIRHLDAFEPQTVVSFLTGASVRLLIARACCVRRRRLAFVVREGGNFRLPMLFRRPLVALLRFLYLRLADRVVVNSPSLAANLFAFDPGLGNRVEIIPNILVPRQPEVEAARHELIGLVGDHSPSPLLVAIGSFQDDRNYLLLGRALHRLLDKHPQAHLIIVGRTGGPECSAGATRFRVLLGQLGISKHVTLTGELPNAARLIPGADLFVLSSKLEGSSNGLAEALQAGAAIASTPVADAVHLVGMAGQLSSGWTANCLADAMAAAIERRDHFRRLAGQQGLRLLEERSPNALGYAWKELLEQVSASRAKVQSDNHCEVP